MLKFNCGNVHGISDFSCQLLRLLQPPAHTSALDIQTWEWSCSSPPTLGKKANKRISPHVKWKWSGRATRETLYHPATCLYLIRSAEDQSQTSSARSSHISEQPLFLQSPVFIRRLKAFKALYASLNTSVAGASLLCMRLSCLRASRRAWAAWMQIRGMSAVRTDQPCFPLSPHRFSDGIPLSTWWAQRGASWRCLLAWMAGGGNIKLRSVIHCVCVCLCVQCISMLSLDKHWWTVTWASIIKTCVKEVILC